MPGLTIAALQPSFLSNTARHLHWVCLDPRVPSGCLLPPTKSALPLPIVTLASYLCCRIPSQHPTPSEPMTLASRRR
ncbi:hypothetical protein ACCO45_010873 [Purpureocillium lilacinum]|uniref:Uncharacterized protein n=1 Tax=Purpureocillium lilacinum TaxID=33203 RepID=A0ACC4DJ31_PURLI